MRKQMAYAVMAAAMVLGAGPASAQQCQGFSDVTDDGVLGLCGSVEWIKNRGVTSGCPVPAGSPPGSYYCPSAVTSRDQMARFLQRVGKALTTEVMKDHVTLQASTIPGELPANPLIACDTGVDSTVVAYPRKALLHAGVTGLADGNPVAWRAFWLYSTDGGVTFQAIMDGANSISSPRASSAANQWSGAALAFALDLPANTPLRVMVGIRRDNVLLGTTGNFAQVRCQMTVGIVNANGTTSPL